MNRLLRRKDPKESEISAKKSSFVRSKFFTKSRETAATKREELSYSHGKPKQRFVYSTLPDLLDHRAQTIPNREAHVFWNAVDDGKLEREVVTYKDLQDNSLKLASSFLKMGLKQEDRIVMAGFGSPEWLYVEYAALRTKMFVIRLPLNIMDGENIIATVSKYNCKAVIVDAGDNDDVLDSIVEATPGVKSLKKLVKSKSEFHLITLKQNGSQSLVKTVADLLEGSEKHVEKVVEIGKTIRPDDHGLISSTSGSSGFPKMIVSSHFSHINNLCAADNIGMIDPIGRFFNDKPFSWIGSAIFSPVVYGMTEVHMEIGFTSNVENVEIVASVLAEEEITMSSYMSTFLKAVIDGKVDTPSTLQYVLSIGGDPMTPAMIKLCTDKFSGAVEIYGSTECFMLSRFLYLPKGVGTGAPERHMNPLPHVEMRITDDEGRTLPINQVGHLWTRSPYLLHEYLDDPDLTEKVIGDGGWFNTGDCGLMTERRRFVHMGRQSEVFKRKGRTLYPKMIEDFIYTFPKVDKVVVAGVPDEDLPDNEKEVCACVTYDTGHYVSAAGLRRFFERNKPKDKSIVTPKYIAVFIDEPFPTLANGKIDRKKTISMGIDLLIEQEKNPEHGLDMTSSEED